MRLNGEVLYHSGGLELLVSERGKRYISFFEKYPGKYSFLISYYYIRDKHLEFIRKYKSLFNKIILDSGAFSVFASGKPPIDVYLYNQFIKTYGKLFDSWVSLDVIGDAKGSYENYMIQKKAGLDVIPVFHPLFETDDWLEKYLKETDYIGLGGMAGKDVDRELQRRRLEEVFHRLVEARPSVYYKTHGFGIGSAGLVQRYPWFTIDSSVIIQLAVRGMVNWRGKVFSVSSQEGIELKDHFYGLPTVDQEIFKEWLNKEFGKTVKDLAEDEALRYIVSIHQLSEELEPLLNYKAELSFGKQLNLF